MLDRFSPEASAVVHQAQEEAIELGHDYVGTEHLLLGLLGDEGVEAILASVGVRGVDVRADLAEIVGECEARRPIRPDPEALRSLGIDLDEVRRRVEETFGPGALEATCAWQRGHALRLTPRSKKSLELALRESMALGHGHIEPVHVLLGLLREGEGIAVMVLSGRAGSPRRVREAVLGHLRRPA
jgi:ATP-dependent Clp protease ATP-binding subunit ClpA